MDVSRRSFLGGALMIAAASLVPVAAFTNPVPILWGDGEHDDAPALQALIDGKPFEVAGSGFIARGFGDNYELMGGKFLLGQGLHFRDNGRTGSFVHNHFVASDAFPENDAMLRFHTGALPTNFGMPTLSVKGYSPS